MNARVVATVVVSAVLVASACGSDVEPSSTTRVTAASTTTTTTTVATTTTTSTTTTVPTGPAVQVRGGDGSRREVALTFDAGSDAGATARILDVLGASEVAATFGITGRFAERNPELVRRIAADGHVVMNHSYDHRSFTGFSTDQPPLAPAERVAELADADAAIAPLLGHSTRPWFRPPYGDTDAGVDALLGAEGYRYDVLWTVDSLGWQGLAPPAVVERCLDGAAPGAIFLFHVGAASTDVEALPAILGGLRSQGYAFVTVAELLR